MSEYHHHHNKTGKKKKRKRKNYKKNSYIQHMCSIVDVDHISSLIIVFFSALFVWLLSSADSVRSVPFFFCLIFVLFYIDLTSLTTQCSQLIPHRILIQIFFSPWFRELGFLFLLLFNLALL